MIKSCYLPDEALQGEEIPAHLIWKNFEWDQIEISFSPPLIFQRIYNVPKSGYKINNNSLIIEEVEIDGYIGLVFSSHRVENSKSIAKLRVKIFKNGKEVWSEERSIALFHPKIRVATAPKKLVIKQGKVLNPIELRKVGVGSVILDVIEGENNEAKIDLNKEYKLRFEKFKKVFKERLEALKELFPHYIDILNELIRFDAETEEDSLSPLDKHYFEIRYDEYFIDSITKAFIRAYVESFEIESLITMPLLKYLEKAISHKVIFKNIFTEIFPSGKEEKLHIILLVEDLLGQIDEIEIPECLIEGEKGESIPIFKLILIKREGEHVS